MLEASRLKRAAAQWVRVSATKSDALSLGPHSGRRGPDARELSFGDHRCMVGYTISKLKKERLVFILSPKYISPNKCDHTEFINQSRIFQSESTLLIASPGQQAL